MIMYKSEKQLSSLNHMDILALSPATHNPVVISKYISLCKKLHIAASVAGARDELSSLWSVCDKSTCATTIPACKKSYMVTWKQKLKKCNIVQ